MVKSAQSACPRCATHKAAAKAVVLHAIDTRYHYLRDCMEEVKIDVEYVSTEDQLTDILTKSLRRAKFLEMRRMKKPP
jgi:predicted RNA-binding protein